MTPAVSGTVCICDCQ